LSFAQERLWFLSQLEPANTAYHLPEVVRLKGALEPETLSRALAELVRRHEALRTVFAESHGRPVQVVLTPEKAAFALEREAIDADDTPALVAAIDRETHRPFDLTTGPLFRTRLLEVVGGAGGEGFALVLAGTMHLIVTDGWSMGVLASALAAISDSFSRGEPIPLEPPRVQYPVFALS